MKHVYPLSQRLQSLPFLFLLFFLFSCEDKVEYTRTYTLYEPVYLSLEEIRSSFDVVDPRVLEEPGRIYMYGHYLFINEPGEGIHVIDNTDKSKPQNIKFITLPGNYDFAARGGLLYANNYMDLVVMDISDINNIQITSRIENIFSNTMSAGYVDPEKGVVVDWTEKQNIEVSSKDFGGDFPPFYHHGGGWFASSDLAVLRAEFNAMPAGSGVGGSMARFTIVDHYLYTIDSYTLFTFNIENPENITQAPVEHVGWGIETIFPNNGNLFIGAQNGMHIYSISEPFAPKRLSQFMHANSCDPVVVHEDIAYVTLRGGTECGGFTNQLDVINISDLNTPQLLVSHAMSSPYGLGYDQGLLFICEGEGGLKVFDATDVYKIDERLLDHITGIHAYDVIPYQDVLLLIGKDGLYQYDYSNPADLELLSHLVIQRKNLPY